MVAEYESMQETLNILGDDEVLADLRQSCEDFAADDTFDAEQVRAELPRRRGTACPRPACRRPSDAVAWGEHGA
jgi:antitoxin YefM